MKVRENPLYMWDNEPLSSITHFAGVLFATIGAAVLIVAAALRGTTWHIVGFSIFGATLILLYTASGTYHLIPASSRHKTRFQTIDHAMIFVLIAGTCTPLCLTVLRGPWGWSLLGVAWTLAILGIALKAFKVRISARVRPLLYICMGWLPIIAVVPLGNALHAGGLVWLFAGGILYTAGTIFYWLDTVVPRNRWIGMHEVFHLFVLAGSASHFWLMFRYVLV